VELRIDIIEGNVQNGHNDYFNIWNDSLRIYIYINNDNLW